MCEIGDENRKVIFFIPFFQSKLNPDKTEKKNLHERQVVENLLDGVGVFPDSEGRHLAEDLLLAFRVPAKIPDPDLIDPGQERVVGLEARLDLVEPGHHVALPAAFASEIIS